ncbi:MAG: hypothetical protein HY924_00735, partial [Elusimicrobia bacterium]|nr:hypothetical protein [Elusimicrobiota bacterium]
AATDSVNPRVLRAGDTMTGQLTIANSTLTVTGNAFSVGVSTLVVKDGMLGLGTTGPQARLSVSDSNANTVFASKGFLEINNDDSTADNTFGVAFRQNDTGGTRQTVANMDIIGASHGVGGQSGSLAFGTRSGGAYGERLRIKYDGSVGIGTSDPSVKLHIAAAAPSIRLEHTAGPDITMHTNDGSGFAGIKVTDGTNLLSIQDSGDTVLGRASGSVGIGVTSPSSKLQVLDGDIRVSTSIGQPSKGIIFQDDTSLTTAGGANSWAPVAGSSIANANAGNVGIGTNDPDVKLHLVGNMHIDTSGTSSLTRNVTVKSGGSMLDWASYGGGWAPGLMLQGTTPAGADSASEFLFLSALDDTQPTLIASGKDLEIYTGAPLGSSGNRSLYLGGTGNFHIGVDAGRIHSAANSTFLGYQAGYSNTSGANNSFVGYQAGRANSSAADNSFLGFEAGLNTTIGNANSFFGSQAGRTNAGGIANTFLGNAAGYTNNSGTANVFVGYQSGYLNTSNNNSFVGHNSGRNTGSGANNSFFGQAAGYTNTTGSDNAYHGFQAGYGGSTANSNSMVGYRAGFNTTASSNTFIGYLAGYSNTSGQYNLFLGNQAGYSNGTGGGNVFIGYQAGYSETNSNTLYIDNSNTATPLLYGDFSQDIVNVNNRLGIGIGSAIPSYPLVVRQDDAWASLVSRILVLNHTTSGAPAAGIGVEAAFMAENSIGVSKEAGLIQAALTNVASGSENGFLAFHTINAGATAEWVRIANDGKVGVGTTQPGATLEVNGDMRVGTTAQTGSANRFRMLQAMVRVTKSANQTLGDNTLTAITWDVETFDTDGMHDNATNNTRLTAPITGKYLVGATLVYNENTTGGRGVHVRKNGATYYGGNEPQTPAAGGTFHDAFSHTTLVDLAAGEYVEILGHQQSTVGLDVLSGSNPISQAWMTYVGE